MLARSVFISGANRGIGLELVNQLIKAPAPPEVIFATCRDVSKAKDLVAAAHSASQKTEVVLLTLDVCDSKSISAAATEVSKKVGDKGLTLLVNNAGSLAERTAKIDVETEENLMHDFHTNCVGTILLTKALLPSLRAAAKHSSGNEMSVGRAAVINVSTKMACISDNTGGGYYSYRCSKTALNMATKSMSVDLKPDGILVIPIHPGHVRTDMGGPQGLIDATESINGILNVLKGLSAKDTGVFYDYKGQVLPW